MRRLIARAATTCAVVVSAVFLTMCGSDSGSLLTVHNGNYLGNGSVYDWELNDDGTFCFVRYDEIADRADSTGACDPSGDESMEVNGTYEVLNGFYKFTVTAASGTDAPTVGDTAGGFGVPGVFLGVKPLNDSDDEIKIFPAVGTCPTSTLSFNWVKSGTTGEEGDLTGKDFWGNASIPTGTNQDITGTRWILDGTETALDAGTTTSCANGIIGMDDGGFITMTPSGIGIVAPGGGGGIIAVPRPESDLSTDVLNGREFAALIFHEGNSQGSISAATFTGTSTGANYTVFEDPFLGTTGESGSMTIDVVGTGEKRGFIKIEVQPGGGSDIPTFWATVVDDVNGTGKMMFIGTGVAVNGTTNDESFTVFAIEK